MNKNILVLNNISKTGLSQLVDYNVEAQVNPDAILLRSQNLHEYNFESNLLAVGRAGAGVNNIPIDKLSEKGIVVFNTPGANANAVKELVLSAMLISARNLFPANDFVKTLKGTDEEIDQETEAQKKNFAGMEIAGKTLGIVGLGAIGVMLANTALELGMKVIGYDPAITIQNAWRLSAHASRANNLAQLYAEADYVSFHVPLIPATKGLFSKEQVLQVKKGVTILNFSRAGIVDSEAILLGIKEGKIKYYCCDFPQTALQGQSAVLSFPHLGASTAEAEENCATMVCKQVKDYLETGNISNSVNLPEIELPPIASGCRLVIINRNIPNMLAEISGKLGSAGFNIVDMINKSRGDYACTIADTDAQISLDLVTKLAEVPGILKVRVI